MWALAFPMPPQPLGVALRSGAAPPLARHRRAARRWAVAQVPPMYEYYKMYIRRY